MKTHTSPAISPKEVAKESQQTCFFVMKLEIFAEQQLLHLKARSEQSLQDRKLLTKVAAGDMPGIDSYYHTGCLTALYNRLRSISPKKEENIITQISLKVIALAELVAYIEDNAKQTVFNLSDLSKLYSSSN